MIAFIREPGSQWLKDARPGIAFIPEKPKEGSNSDAAELPGDFMVRYAPGQPPERFQSGQAKLIKADSGIVLQIHCTTNGTAGMDVSKAGLVFAKEPPPTVTLYGLHPHMHARRKDLLYKVKYPDGRTETPLSVPNYSFAWQRGDQSWDELMTGFFNFVFDASMPVENLYPPKKRVTKAPTKSE